jgi:hypothetical protein
MAHLPPYVLYLFGVVAAAAVVPIAFYELLNYAADRRRRLSLNETLKKKR